MQIKQQRQIRSLDRSWLVVKFSSRQVKEAQQDVLALGLHELTMAPKQVPVEDIIARNEQTSINMNEKDERTFREEIQRCLRAAEPPKPTLTLVCTKCGLHSKLMYWVQKTEMWFVTRVVKHWH